MGPYKGAKSQLWEGGIRVPAAVRWPTIIAAGQESDQPIITMDWSATILDAAGANSDSVELDGMSLLSHFKDPGHIVPRRFYWRVSNHTRADAYRDGDWKYLHTPQGEFLFNLTEDPYEQQDLKAGMPDKFEKLKAAFTRLNAEMLEPVILQ
jgi:arylsulfatase A-like enzyme